MELNKVLIIGATSAIAAAVARRFAESGATLFLAGRDSGKLARLASDLLVRGAKEVFSATFNAADLPSHEALITEALAKLGEIDGVLIAHGSLPDQNECQESWEATFEALAVNFLSPVRLLTSLATYFEGRGKGSISVISSVAGDRGRQSNYVYGASKGGLSTFLEGLRNRLAAKGVAVTTIKPGFVDTPMTAHIPKTKLFASPEAVGGRIHSAMLRGDDVVYTPFIWWPIMTIIRAIPERIFKKLKL